MHRWGGGAVILTVFVNEKKNYFEEIIIAEEAVFPCWYRLLDMPFGGFIGLEGQQAFPPIRY
jgi:hypothetical protein